MKSRSQEVFKLLQKPNIVFLVLDAVRADHVGCYGYGRPTTPNIDALATNGIRYENAFSPSIWTPTVHGAIFTGRYPSHSGIYGNSLAIPDHLTTLPEKLKEAGYRTFAASAGAHIRRDRGYDRGVDEYVETRRISPELGFVRKVLTDRSFASQVAFSLQAGPDDKTLFKFDRLERFVRENASKEHPFFGFVNFKTAHSPFNPPRPYKEMFCEELNRPRWEVIERILGAIGLPGQSIDGYDEERLLQVARSGGDEVFAGDIEFTDDDWSVLKSWYDGAIRYLDDRIGQFVDVLKDLGIFEDTLLVVTSDHGDNFGDHGFTGHAFCLYDSLLHVPLVISPPKRESTEEVVQNQISLIDLHPTFLETAGLESFDYAHSKSLHPLGDRQFHDYTFAEYAGYEGPRNRLARKFPSFETGHLAKGLQSVRSEDYKLIAGGDGTKELYQWKSDPAEEVDLSDNESSLVEELSRVLETSLGELTPDEPLHDPEDDDLRSQLEHLGYR